MRNFVRAAGRLSPAALATVLRRPGDPSTENGRAQMRHRAIVLTSLASAFARGMSILTALASVPLTLHYLGTERYGMWLALSAFSALLSFSDFGIGNSVLTAVAHAAGRSEISLLKRQISSAYVAMIGIGIVMLAVLASAYPFVAWDRLFNVTTATAKSEAGPAAAVFFVIMALSTPASLVMRIQLGLQQGFRANLWQGGASVAALVALFLATRLQASLPWLVLALAGTPVLFSLFNTLDFFAFRRPGLYPERASFDFGAISKLLKNGALFLALQICAALMLQVNAIIIAQVLGASAVAAYAVPERMFGVVGMISAIFLTPLWPAYGDAAARGDLGWVRRTLRRSLIFGIGGTTLISAGLVVLAPQLIRLWVGDAIVTPFILILGLGIWKVIETAGNAVAMFLNGVNELKIQVMLFP